MAIANVLFLPWPSWAKLSFVLGGLLIVVGTIATVAKVMKWRKLLRLESCPEEQAERGEISVDAIVNLPFGVKALDDGSSFEGVWNARTATPLHGPRSRNSSPLIQASRILKRSKRDVSVSSIPSLDIGESSSAVVVAKAHVPSPPHDDSVAPARSTAPRRNKPNSITINYSGPSARSKPAAGPGASEYCNLLLSDDHMTFSSQTCPPEMASFTKLKLRSSPKKNPTTRKFVIGGRDSLNQSVSSKPDHGDVITRMEAHRRLHSAESGQLMPKIRPKSETNATIDVGYCVCEDSDGSGRTVSWAAGENSQLSRKLPQKPEIISQASAKPLVAIIESRTASRQCPSAWTDRMQGQVDEQLIREVSVAERVDRTPSLCSDTTVSTAVLSNEAGTIENKSSRKVNDGFELLPAGTFDKEPKVKVLWPSSFKEEAEALKKPRRLQKHKHSGSMSSMGARSSIESRRSRQYAFLHTVY